MKKQSVLIASAALCGAVLLSALMPGTFDEDILLNDFLTSLQKKLTAYDNARPEDRLYVMSDKPLYKPGETIWFSAWVHNASDMKPSGKSEIIHTELIDPKGNVAAKADIIARDGAGNAQYDLGKEAMGGQYKIRAYTNWMKNTDDSFEKEIQVQNVILPHLKMKLDFARKSYGPSDEVVTTVKLHKLDNQALADQPVQYIVNLDGKSVFKGRSSTDESGTAYLKYQLPDELQSNDGLVNVMLTFEGKTESISRSIPIKLGGIDLDFFPEGGDMVEGLSTRIGFKASDEFGKPADVEGVIKDPTGRIAAHFSSLHNGMGRFDFTPGIGAKYEAMITKPEGINKTFALPTAMKRGWVLNINHREDGNLEALVMATDAETMSLMCQVRGKACFAREMDIQHGTNSFFIPTDKMPAGVCQITLFDSHEVERAERLVFVNKDRHLNISLETSKEQYLPREEVDLTVRVSDERGMPMPAQLALSVVDDKLLSFADDRSGNILTKMLLEDDLKQKVEEPGYYFDPEEKDADRALDNLLLTEGWRRFTWKAVRSNDLPAIRYQGEHAILAGVVTNQKGEAVKGATITLEDGSKRSYTSDNTGHFEIRDVDIYQPFNALVTSDGLEANRFYINRYNEHIAVQLHPPYRYDLYAPAANRAGAGGRLKNVIVEGERMMKMGELEEDIPMEALEKVENMEMPVQVVEDEKKEAELKDMMDQGIEADTIIANGMIEAFDWEANADKALQQPAAVTYIRSREFPAPDYQNDQTPERRIDFRTTTYWNGDVSVGDNGMAELHFYNNDAVSSFRITAEGIGVGMVGHSEKTIFTQKPFSMYAKMPAKLIFGDVVTIPVTLTNNMDHSIKGTFKVETPQGLSPLNTTKTTQDLAANSSKTINLNYRVDNQTGASEISIEFTAEGSNDAFSQAFSIGAKGFPVDLAFSGQEKKKSYAIDISDPVEGTISARLTAYPNVVNDLMSGIESIIREPSGCFEQTSMSNYPNIMAMNYLRETGQDDPKLLASIEPKLDRGYKRLTSFETKEKGYEWFGSAPGHEALTAYGLMQFNDMRKVYPSVSAPMIERTAKWLMSRRDGKGGFKKNPRALDQFGRASDEVTTGYIVYALSEAGYKNLNSELENAYDASMKSGDAYQLAMLSNSLLNFNDKRSGQAIQKLIKEQNDDGSWNADHSITRSGGKSLMVETTAIASLALMKDKSPHSVQLQKAMQFLVSARGPYGGFGSTQATVLALKALTEYARISKQTKGAGSLNCYVDGKKAGSVSWQAGSKEEIVIEGLEQYLTGGQHKIEVRYDDASTPLPYTVSLHYNTNLPQSSANCQISIDARLELKEAKVGETVRLHAVVGNKTDRGMPMTMAVLGIPAGLSPQSWQLNEMVETHKIGFYELSGNYVIIYYRDMAPGAQRKIDLDLKAEVPGRFEAPASCAYLYYTAEDKCWISTREISIRK